MFKKKVLAKYKIVAIIPKDQFKKGTDYSDTFYEHFDKEKYKEVMPKLTDLFRKLNGGKLKSTVVVDFTGHTLKLKPIDLKMIEALQKLGYTVDEEMYKVGIVVSSKGKQVPLLEILKSKGTKARGYDKLKEQYEKTKDTNIKKELEFYDDISSMQLLDSTKKIDVKRLSIYDKTKIVFTYDHRAIASQSTKVGWSSCMSLDGSNEYKRHVGGGASEGAFVAYLVDSGDDKIADPTARVLFKPYFGQLTGDIIWECDKAYVHQNRSAPANFRSGAQAIIDKLQPPKEDIYHLTSKTYVDVLPKTINHIKYEGSLLELKNNPKAISKIEDPSEMEQFVAVSQDYRVFKDIKNPTENVQLAAVRKGGNTVLKLIKDKGIEPSDAVIKAAKGAKDIQSLADVIADSVPDLIREHLTHYLTSEYDHDHPLSREWEYHHEGREEEGYQEMLDDADIDTDTQSRIDTIKELCDDLEREDAAALIFEWGTDSITSLNIDDDESTTSNIVYKSEIQEDIEFDDFFDGDAESRPIFSDENPNREDDVDALNRLLPPRVTVTEGGTLRYGEGAGVFLVLDDAELEKLIDDLKRQVELKDKNSTVDADAIALDPKAHKETRILALDRVTQDTLKTIIGDPDKLTKTDDSTGLKWQAARRLTDKDFIEQILRSKSTHSFKSNALTSGVFVDKDLAKDILEKYEKANYFDLNTTYIARLIHAINDPKWALEFLAEHKDAKEEEEVIHSNRIKAFGYLRDQEKLGAMGIVAVMYQGYKAWSIQTIDEFFEKKPFIGETITSLRLSNSNIKTLPNDIKVPSDLKVAENSTIYLNNCTALKELPENFDCWHLDLTGCTALKRLPNGLDAGDVTIVGCTALEEIPEDVSIARLICDESARSLIPSKADIRGIVTPETV